MKRCKICGDYVEPFHHTYEIHEECYEQKISLLERALRRIIHEAVIQGVLRCPPKMSKKCSEYTEKTDCWYDYILAEAKGEEQ
jgi:hypothetical protein